MGRLTVSSENNPDRDNANRDRANDALHSLEEALRIDTIA